MTQPTLKEVLDHILNKVLEVDAKEIKSISKIGVKFYRQLVSFDFKDFDTLREDGNITISCWRDMTDFKLYIEATSSSYTFIMTMTSGTWEPFGVSMLRINQALASTSIDVTQPTLINNIVKPSQIETTPFLKYVHLTLLDKRHFP